MRDHREYRPLLHPWWSPCNDVAWVNVPGSPEPVPGSQLSCPSQAELPGTSFPAALYCSEAAMAFGCPSVTLATRVLCPLTSYPQKFTVSPKSNAGLQQASIYTLLLTHPCL